MLEILVVTAIAGYIYYLRNYADLRSGAEKEADRLAPGIQIFRTGKIAEAFEYFNQKIIENQRSPVAYLYRARCYMANGDWPAATSDVEKGLSYDDSVFELHLELGKLRFETKHYSEALIYLNKAILRSSGNNAEAYHWRALTHEKMGNFIDAKNDFAQENSVLDTFLEASSRPEKQNQKLVDRRLIANSLLTIFTTGLLLWIIKHADSIHLPYLLTVAASVSLGFVEPHKGWVLALIQGILLWLGYIFFTAKPQSGGQSELENFSLYGSIILTFAGSFLGAFLKRALNG